MIAEISYAQDDNQFKSISNMMCLLTEYQSLKGIYPLDCLQTILLPDRKISKTKLLLMFPILCVKVIERALHSVVKGILIIINK